MQYKYTSAHEVNSTTVSFLATQLNLIPSPSITLMFMWQQKQRMPVQSNHSPVELECD